MSSVIIKVDIHNESVSNITINKSMHKSLGISLDDFLIEKLQSIFDIGLKVQQMKVDNTGMLNSVKEEVERKCSESHASELKAFSVELNHLRKMKSQLESDVQEWKDKYSCIRSTLKTECQSIVADQAATTQRATMGIQRTLDDLKNTVTHYHSKTASTKTVGASGEDSIMQYIAQHYPKWEIIDTHGQPYQGDFHTKIDNYIILNEVKTHKGSIRTDQVQKFYRDIDECKPSAAFLFSLHSNIVGKEHGHYEMRGKTHVIFMSNVADNYSSIKFAHSIFLTLMKSSQTDYVDEDEDDLCKEDYENQLRSMQLKNETSIDIVKSNTNYLISIYQKNIKHDTKKIRDLKKSLVTFTTLACSDYENDNEETKLLFPWVCDKCNRRFKKRTSLINHLSSSLHICTLKQSN